MFNFLDNMIMYAEETGIYAAVYDTFNNLSMVLAAVFCLWYGYKLKFPFVKRLIITAITAVTLFGLMTVILWADTGFTSFDRKEITVTYAFTPLLAYICSKILKLPISKTLDFFAFPPIIIHAIARWGCIFAGCCYGYVNEFGIYNLRDGQKHFPIQIIETIIAVSIICALVIISKKKNYNTGGIILPLGMLIYGGTRFINEFLHDNYKVFFGLSSVALHCIVIIIVGLILLGIVIKMNKKEASVCNE